MLSIAAQAGVTAALALWVAAVVLWISRLVYTYAMSRGLNDTISKYISRKTIHILGGGVTAAVVPVVYAQPWFPLASAIAITGYLHYRRAKNIMSWFQEENNAYEEHFALMWGLVILLSWLVVRNLTLGVVSAMFMSVGDGITGIVRGLRGVRGKAWSGTLAMLATCVLIGFYYLGLSGAVGGAIASIAERVEGVDDNITVPIASFLAILLVRYLVHF